MAAEVTNISPNANEKTVSDFFSFCGKITKLYLDKEQGKETSRAVIEFQTESASKTALLLTNALIVDRPISVTPFSIDVPKEAEGLLQEPGTPVPEERITHRDFGGVHDEERTKTSVLASLMASGYILANDAFNKAKEIDDEHNISLQLKVGVEMLKVKAHEVDQQYKISEKAASVKQQATEKAKKLDEEYKITEKATTAANSVKASTLQAAAKGVETVKSGWAAATQAVTDFYTDYKDQTSRAIEEKKKEKASHTVAPEQAAQEVRKQQEEAKQDDASLPPQIPPAEENM